MANRRGRRLALRASLRSQLELWLGLAWLTALNVRDVEICVERVICYIPGCICCGSENFGLGYWDIGMLTMLDLMA